MRFNTLSRYELNVFNPIFNLAQITDLAVRHGVSAVVAIPEHIQALILQRGMANGKYKIICALDFDEKYFALDKISKLRADPIGADGYEITNSSKRSEVETRNEIKILTQFLRSNNRMAEIRWCLNYQNKTELELDHVIKHLREFPAYMLRLDRRPGKLDDYKKLVEKVRASLPYPIKLDGCDSEVFTYFEKDSGIFKFDISYDAAQILVRPPQPKVVAPTEVLNAEQNAEQNAKQ